MLPPLSTTVAALSLQIAAMAHIQQYPDRSSTDSEDFQYPEPNYPYIYAPRSEAGYTTPAVSHAPLPPASVAPSHRSSPFTASRPIPERAYSDTSRTSGDSFITPSLSASQVGNRTRNFNYARSYASQPRSRATSYVSRDDLRPSRPPTTYSPSISSKPPLIITSPSRAPTTLTAASSSSRPIIRRLRSALKKPRPTDSASYTSGSSEPEVIHDSPTLMSAPLEPSFPVPPPMEAAPSEISENRRSMAPSTVSPSAIIQKTRFHGNTVNASRHLAKAWDARSPPRLDSATRAAPAFDARGITSVQLIASGLPWSVHVRAGVSRSRSRSRSGADQISVGDVLDSIYAALNKSLTRTDVRAASNETKRRIARAAAAAERESQRGEHSARTGKPSAARRIDYLGSRVWFLGLEKNDEFARQEGYGVDNELKKVWVMRFGSSPSSSRATTV